jgi:hypothetical protein
MRAEIGLRNGYCNCFNIASVAGVQNSPGASLCVNKETPSQKLIDTQRAEIGPRNGYFNCFNIATVAGVQNSPGASPCVKKEAPL